MNYSRISPDNSKRRPRTRGVVTSSIMKKKCCEVCNEEVQSDYDLCGCEKCGRMYGPCCNSESDSICVDCN